MRARSSCDLRGSSTASSRSLLFVAVLILAYIGPGLVGHDPWKQDETYTFSIIENILHGGDWVVPRLAGEPFMEKPPLYFVTAAATAKLLSGVLSAPDGARIATGLYFLITVFCLALASRQLYGSDRAPWTLVVLLGCVGLLSVRAMFSDAALLAGTSAALLGLVQCPKRPMFGGLLLGTGAGMAFLSKGLLVPAALALAVLALIAAVPLWRTARTLSALAVAAVAVLPWIVIWPWLLYTRSPHLFLEWFWLNNVGRFLGFSVAALGAESESFHWIKHLPWFTLPALPLAVHALIQVPRTSWRESAYAIPLAFGGALAMLLACAASARPHYALPLLLPLSLLATPGLFGLSNRVARGWRTAGVALFGTAALALLALWTYLVRPGDHVALPYLGGAVLPDAAIPLSPWAVAAAVAVCAVWLVAVRMPADPPRQAAVAWAAGLALVSGLAFTLLLPWIDAVKSFKEPFTSLRQALPSDHECINGVAIGESERAMLQYYAGLVTEPATSLAGLRCNWVLIEMRPGRPPVALGPEWHLAWVGSRRGSREAHGLFWRLPR